MELLLKADHICLEYTGREVLNIKELELYDYDRIGLIGTNGAGKSTLFNLILQQEAGIAVSPKAKIGYFAQNGYKFNRDQEVMSFMVENCAYQQSEIRSVLALWVFHKLTSRKS